MLLLLSSSVFPVPVLLPHRAEFRRGAVQFLGRAFAPAAAPTAVSHPSTHQLGARCFAQPPVHALLLPLRSLFAQKPCVMLSPAFLKNAAAP